MRPRKAEVEAMIALLDAEYADVEALAKDALVRAWELAEARKRYGVVIDQPGVGVTLHGPFDTTTQADRFLKAFPFAGPAKPRVMVTGISTDLEDTHVWESE